MAELCFSVDDFILDFFSNTAADTASEYDSYGHRRCWTSSGLVPLLLPSAPRQAGRACSASCVLFSYSCKNSFDLMTAESFAHFCSCNFWHQAGPAPFNSCVCCSRTCCRALCFVDDDGGAMFCGR